MEQEHRITYKAGITRTPSDFLCQDGELAECINLATDNEELKPVVQPASYITSAENTLGDAMEVPIILCIHKFNDDERYIGYREMVQHGHTLYPLCWYTKDGTKLIYQADFQSNGSIYYSSETNVTSVGKTLIVSNSNGMQYFIWSNEVTYLNNQEVLTPFYKNVGDIPDPVIDFWLEGDSRIMKTTTTYSDFDYGVISNASATGIHFYLYVYNNGIIDQEAFNDLIAGLYSKNKKMVAERGGFCEPFFIRYALRLKDGSITHVSEPILMFPCVTRNSYAIEYVYEGESNLYLFTKFCKLYYSLDSNGLDDFRDIIDSIEIYVSNGICPYLFEEQTAELIDKEDNRLLVNGINKIPNDVEYSAYNSINKNESDYDTYWAYIDTPRLKRNQDVINEIISTSIFYKICELGLSSSSGDLSEKIKTNTLLNLTTQEYIENDDYFSRNRLSPQYIHSYNSRLNICSVKRGLFEGFDFFMPFDNGTNEYSYDFYVKIHTDEREVWIKHSAETSQKQGLYFYYPDQRAKHVTIYKRISDSELTCVCDEDLIEHSGLHGAYFFRGLPGIPGNAQDEVTGITVDQRKGFVIGSTITNSNYQELLSNYIIQSEVNNPWVFKAEGYFKVGTGKIIGMSSITQALSQGQFGQYPLLVFSESGIWALSVGSEGYYTAIHPMSRDVCINPGSILQTDGAVFFVSKKGLMVVAGKEVVCVSERMNGATFNTAQLSPLAADTDWEDIVEACQDSNSFLDYIRDEGMFMAYDYIDSRIVMVNPRFGYSFIYNIADATISKVILPAAMTNAVNNSPDYLIQGLTEDSHQRVYSFYGKKREEEVTGRQLGFLLTRPMKLSGPTAKASLRQLMHVGMWNKGTASNPLSCVKTEIWLSDDLQTWYSDISRFGTAAKYYRLALYIKMLPTERLSGTILTEQPRRTKNLK